MERALKKDIEQTFKEFILKRLAETHHFEAPDTLVERELTAMVRHHLAVRRRQRGAAADFDEPGKRQEEIKRLREEHLPEATRRVKVGLILEAIADKDRLTVEVVDVSAEIERIVSEIILSDEEARRMVEVGGEESGDEVIVCIHAHKA